MKIIKKNKRLIFGMIFLIGILISLTFVSASFGYSRSSPRYTQPGMSSFDYMRGSEGINLYPVLDREKCGMGQDFIIQVAPTGCTPSVVRSDLLEEQNVPVFCPLMATKVNPLIDVEAIDHITFKGNYPKGVSGIGFHPANAALKTSAREMLNSPVLENIGYAVVVLKKQRNESAMPEWIVGNMTAVLRYDLKNAFGVGAAQFNLPLVSEEKWDEDYRAYGFWRGKGYLRAENIGTDDARISVFRDVDTRLSSKNLRVGETSEMIYIPGYYCLAGFQLRLDGLEAPDTRAKFEVDGDYFEAAKGEQFLDNKCKVRDLEKNGLVQEVQVRCETDDGREYFKFDISPKINLKIDGVNGTYEVGDILYKDESGRNVFLGFIGETKKTKFIVPVITTHTSKEEFLKSSDLKLIKSYVDYRLKERSTPGLSFVDGWRKIIGTSTDVWGRLFGGFVRGTDYADLIEIGETKQIHFLSDDVKKLSDNTLKVISGLLSFSGKINWDDLTYDAKEITFVGFVEPADKKVNEDFQNYFNQAKQNYRKLVDQFKDEKISEGSGGDETYAETGLFELIKLAESSGQMKTMVGLCDEFKENYPESDLDVGSFCDDELENSNAGVNTFDVYINGRLKTISFKGIYEPSLDEYSADLRISGGDVNEDSVLLKKNQIHYFGNEGDYIQLKKVEDDYIEIDSNVEVKGKEGKREVLRNFKIKFGDDYANLGKGAYRVSVNNINLKKEARVRVIPKIRNGETEANFDFKIGIEKRAIQLSPEKIASKIDNLDEQIEKLDKISNTLDKTVKGLNKACLGTGAALTIKNLLANTGGKALARQKVMRGENGDGGWYDYCIKQKEEGRADSVDVCLYANADKIDEQVEEMAKRINEVNNEMKELYTFEDSIGGKIIDEDKFIEDYSKKVVKGLPSDVDENVRKLLNKESWDNGYFYKDDLRDIDLYSRLAKSGDEDAKKNLNVILSRIEKTAGDFVKTESIKSNLLNKGIKDLGVSYVQDENTQEGIYHGGKVEQGFIGNLRTGDAVQIVIYNNQQYLVKLNAVEDNRYIINDVFDLEGYSVDEATTNIIKSKYSSFQKFDASTYKNEFVDAKIRYYETEPYKGWPGLVPFDLKNGWYAAVRQSLPGGGSLRAYDESGRVASFYLCNVGENGRAEFHNGIKDDICRGFNPANGQIYGNFPGLDERKTESLVRDAIGAIRTAQDKYKRGVRKVKIPGAGNVDVGGTVANVPEIQCQDFMSPKDCHLLFNVCDPVVCPSSRCDLGGNYPVENVIQTGIIGGLTLCAHNFDGGKGVMIPVCLSGINAGVDGLLSMSKSYRDCLDESLKTGQTVGVCDEIHSIYLCEFLWRQAMPFAKLGIPKLLGWITGQNARGGGEYLSVSSAWETAGASVDYFKNYYGANAYKAFKYRTTEDAGTDVCKLSISGSVPVGGDFIDSLTEPVSPVQYHARFDEIPFTTATNPPISQYKVFYHIYAGKDTGAYYRIYLKGSEGSALYQDNPTLKIAQGYIGVGKYATDTPDFTGAAGYKQLCVSINAQEKCGFKEVSTSFAVDYVRDKYLEDQVTRKDITKESECVSGSSTAYSLLNPNLGEGVDEMINPDLYNSGIVRVCSTDNPGAGTDAKAGTKDAQWVIVGYCGDKDLKCWLDTGTVKRNINIDYIEKNSLKEVTDSYQGMLEGNYLSEGEYVELMKELDEMNERDDFELKDLIVKINSNYDKVFLTNQKAALTYYLARANKFLAQSVYGNYLRAIMEKAYLDELDKEVQKELEEEMTLDDVITESEVTFGTFSEVYPKRYALFKSIFEKYAEQNKPNELGEIEFKSLLAAIATQETSMGYGDRCGRKGNEPCEDWLMGYTDGNKYNEQFKGKDNQVKYASNTLMRAFNKISSVYSRCDSQKIGSVARAKCILGVYGPGNVDYDDEVYNLFLAWKEYFETGEFPEDVAEEVVGEIEEEKWEVPKTTPNFIGDIKLMKKENGRYKEIEYVDLTDLEDLYLSVEKSFVEKLKGLFVKIDSVKVELKHSNGNIITLYEKSPFILDEIKIPLNKRLFDNAKKGDVHKYRVVFEKGGSVDIEIGEIIVGKDFVGVGEEIGKNCVPEGKGLTKVLYDCVQKSSSVPESFGESTGFDESTVDSDKDTTSDFSSDSDVPYTFGEMFNQEYLEILKDGKRIENGLFLADNLDLVYFEGDGDEVVLAGVIGSDGEIGLSIFNYGNYLSVLRDLSENYLFKSGIGFVRKEGLSTSSSEKWTVRMALAKTYNLVGKYLDNKVFIDELYEDDVITKEEYVEINGDGLFNLQEDMGYVRDLLKRKIDILEDN